jgi:hypothetical protein
MAVKVAVYTALCGPKSAVRQPEWIRDYIDYLCFTDQPKESIPAPWKVLPLEKTSKDPNRNAKRYKIMPHLVLPKEYGVSVWMDANLKTTKGFDELAWELILHPIVLFRHFERNCIYEEAAVCKSMRLDDHSVIDSQMARYRSEGFPLGYGLPECNVLLRTHQSPETITLMETWWAEICRGSRRDQLSFMYCVWQTGLRDKLHILDRTSRDGYYHQWLPHISMMPLPIET